MNYLDQGYNEFLTREVQSSDPLFLDPFVSEVTGDKVSSGSIVSQNKLLSMNLENNVFKVSDGSIDRVELGNLSDGTIGLIIRDENGNVLMQISGGKNFIQSSDQHMLLDFIANQFSVKNDGGNTIVLLGKLS